MTAALQHLINKMILISESGCCISINVTHTMNSWQLQISNNEIAGQRTEKMFPFIPIIFPVYGYSDLWTVRKIIRLHGGKITGCRHGKAATFQIVIPTDCHCLNQSCPVLRHSSTKTKTPTNDSCENPKSNKQNTKTRETSHILTDVKIVKANTEAIIAGPNPTMELDGYMSEIGNFTVHFSIVKDVAKVYHTILEDKYSASGDYTYQECMDVWKEYCLDYGLTTVNSTTQSYDKTSEAKRLVALCVPIGADSDGNEVIGDLYTVFYDKDKGIITDPSVLFPDAPKSAKGMIGTAKPQVIKKDKRIPANMIIKEEVKKNTPGAMMSGSTIYLDLKKLGKHPHAK